MCTATKLQHRVHDRDLLARQVDRFIARWAPEDREDSSHFNTELIMLVQAIYSDMQRPVTMALENVLMHAVPKYIVLPQENREL